MFLQTEYEFTLPRGYVDSEGHIHREGVMRLATALDELEGARSPEARGDSRYIMVIVLSRVITRLGKLEEVTPQVIQNLFAADFMFLQNMYETINNVEDPVIQIQCPHCGQKFSEILNYTRRNDS